jgi:dolichol-phosphate mannosyltransferase
MLLSIVLPIYNEAEAIPKLLPAVRRALAPLDVDYELIFVDDGSKDQSRELIEREAELDSRIRLLGFSRNFGHQAAITAGLDFATGDAVVVMDADLQDPPELIPEMLALYHQGFDVVSAQRTERHGETAFKRGTAALFYRSMRWAVDERLQPQVSDFRLFSRAAVLAIRQLREQHRFVRGMVAWLGLREAIIPFRRPARIAGETKYSAWKMARFAWTAISSFSALPLKLSLILHSTVRGWSSLVCLQLLFSGATLTAIGLVGDYVARIYEEIKARPLYIVSETRNLPEDIRIPARATLASSRSPAETARVAACVLRQPIREGVPLGNGSSS